MEKTDFKKSLKHLYQPSATQVSFVDVPEMAFLMVSGIDANGRAFQDAIQALYGVSYKIKFHIKKTRNIDYGVMPLEALWWAEDMDDFINGRKDRWHWTLMIMQPDIVLPADVDLAIAEQRKKDNTEALSRLSYSRFREGPSAQLLHIGPFSAEGPNIQKIHAAIIARSGHFDGQVQKHHEIYLSDFRKTAPEKLKTVLRQAYR